MMRRTGGRRAGFTLIELLVVIAIIAVIMGMLMSGVQMVRGGGTNAQNRWLMTQITIGAKDFTGANRGVTYFPLATPADPSPPAIPPATTSTPTPASTFRIKKVYADGDPEVAYLRQIWPRMAYLDGPVSTTDDRYAPGGTGWQSADMTLENGNHVVFFFTTGIELDGFAQSKTQPFLNRAKYEGRDGPYVKGLKQNMYAVDSSGRGQFIDPHGSPYAIFPPRNRKYPAQAFVLNGTTVRPYYRGSPAKYENPDDIQIISAGRDKKFGAGGNWGTADPVGRSNISNFSQFDIGAGPQ